jgi:hypothetical protein
MTTNLRKMTREELTTLASRCRESMATASGASLATHKRLLAKIVKQIGRRNEQIGRELFPTQYGELRPGDEAIPARS